MVTIKGKMILLNFMWHFQEILWNTNAALRALLIRWSQCNKWQFHLGWLVVWACVVGRRHSITKHYKVSHSRFEVVGFFSPGSSFFLHHSQLCFAPFYLEQTLDTSPAHTHSVPKGQLWGQILSDFPHLCYRGWTFLSMYFTLILFCREPQELIIGKQFILFSS